jgi:L-alanine-DL-glutamate epimerase-like enolase superfamily enzyme
LRTFYPELVTESVVIQDGHILAPTAPGLGTALLPDLARRPDATLVESVPT